MPSELEKYRRQYGMCITCGRVLETQGRRCSGCQEWRRLLDLAYRRRLKEAALIAYGGAHCDCCGDTTREFLSLHHINHDGAEHRRITGCGTGTQLHRWLKKHNYPPGFKPWCGSCHDAISFHGYCPCKERRYQRCQDLLDKGRDS